MLKHLHTDTHAEYIFLWISFAIVDLGAKMISAPF